MFIHSEVVALPGECGAWCLVSVPVNKQTNKMLTICMLYIYNNKVFYKTFRKEKLEEDR
jgi:hypothetical protein